MKQELTWSQVPSLFSPSAESWWLSYGRRRQTAVICCNCRVANGINVRAGQQIMAGRGDRAAGYPEVLLHVLYQVSSAARGGAVGWDTALQAGRSRVRLPLLLLEYQKYFLVVKGGRCVRFTPLPPFCACYYEIWEPQPPENLRA
jgi:hypothetical protein